MKNFSNSPKDGLTVKRSYRRFIAGLTAILMAVLPACKRTTPLPKQVFPETYALAYQQIFGHCYDSLPNLAVVALDLYSSGLDLDKDSLIRGTGYNLYISDIFVSDSLLEEGEYTSLNANKLEPKPFTFLPGQNYGGTPHGIYMLTIENSSISQIQIFDSGSFVYRNDSLLFTLFYVGNDGYPAKYECSFSGVLIPWVKK